MSERGSSGKFRCDECRRVLPMKERGEHPGTDWACQDCVHEFEEEEREQEQAEYLYGLFFDRLKKFSLSQKKAEAAAWEAVEVVTGEGLI